MSDTHKPDMRRAYCLARKLKRLTAAVLVVAVTACGSLAPVKHSPDGSSHNAAGGYRDACGETLPGMIGDDC